MEEARRVLDRLDRIETLRKAAARPQLLLEEVRALLAEGEEWTRSERGGTEGADEVLDRVRRALERGDQAAPPTLPSPGARLRRRPEDAAPA